MRISDWSSDVCSSDLVSHTKARLPATMRYQAKGPKPLRLTMPTNHLITSNATMKEITKPTPISLQRTIPDVSWSRYLKSSSVDAPSMVGMARKKLNRSEEHTSELQALMRIAYAVFCLKQTRNKHQKQIPLKN